MGPTELAAFVADLVGRPLDQDSPLWEMHVVEGLESGHVAVVPKLHHVAFDGASGVEVVAVVPRHRARARGRSPFPGRPWRPEPIPTEAELIGSAMSSLVRQPERAAGVLRRTFGAVHDLAERNRRLREEDDVVPPPAPFRAPRTSLNGSISPHRRFAFAQVPLDEIRTVRRVFGGTVNDVVLAGRGGCAASAPGRARGAARRIRRGHGSDVEAVPRPTAAPSATRCRPCSCRWPPQSPIPSSACTTIAAGTRLAKDQARVLSEELIQGWAQLAFPALSSRIARLAGNLRLFDHLPPLFNVLVSNIAGPELASVVCRGPAGGALPDRAHHRGRGPQRHRGELRGHLVLRDPRMP